VGSTVEGHIDWARRFDHMQQHSGEHMISGLICSRYHCDNVGFHMGTDVVTIDFSAEIPEEDLPVLEEAVNRAILEDRPITEAFPSPEELEATEYRSKTKINGPVRLVNAAGMDLCACCGTHMKTTGQIGGIRLLNTKRYKGGSRLELLCGMRIQKHHSLLYRQNESISRLLSAKPLETAAAVSRLRSECDEHKRQLSDVWDRYFALKAASLPEGSIALIEDGAGMDELRKCCAAASEGREVFAAFAPEENGFKFALVSSGADIRGLTKEMNQALSGSGGGKPTFTQGRIKCTRDELKSFLEGKDIKVIF